MTGFISCDSCRQPCIGQRIFFRMLTFVARVRRRATEWQQENESIPGVKVFSYATKLHAFQIRVSVLAGATAQEARAVKNGLTAHGCRRLAFQPYARHSKGSVTSASAGVRVNCKALVSTALTRSLEDLVRQELHKPADDTSLGVAIGRDWGETQMYLRFTGLSSKQLLDWSLKKLKQEMVLTEADKETIAAKIGKRCRGSVSVMTSNARVVVSENAPLHCVNVLYVLEHHKENA